MRTLTVMKRMTNTCLVGWGVASLIVVTAPAAQGAPPADDTTGVVRIEMQIVRAPAPVTVVSDAASASPDASADDSAKPRRAEARPEAKPAPAGNDSTGAGVVLIGDNVSIRAGDALLQVVDGRIRDRLAAADHDGLPHGACQTLSAPTILCNVGQDAAVTVGAAVSYMVRRDDGCLVVEQSPGVREGFSIRLRVDHADETTVSFKNIDLKISMVAERAKVDGVPFDVGRPTIRTIETSSALRLRPVRLALITLPAVTDDAAALFVLLRAVLAEE